MTAPVRRQAALRAMLQVADQRDIPVTVRQLGVLLTAAETALTPDRPARTAAPQAGWVDATPTVTALRSLVAAGWPLAYLAPRLGTTQTELSQRMRRRQVTVRTEAETLAATVRLAGVDPAGEGVPPLAVRKARNWARRQGWADIAEEAA